MIAKQVENGYELFDEVDAPTADGQTVKVLQSQGVYNVEQMTAEISALTKQIADRNTILDIINSIK